MRKIIFLTVIILLTFLALSGICFGDAIEYVDHTYALGGSNGDDATPWTDIVSATAAVSEGGQVLLRNATYTTTQIGADSYIRYAAARSNLGTNHTIDVDTDYVAATTLNYTLNRAFRIDDDNEGYTITVKNMTFTGSGAAERVFHFDTGTGGGMRFEDCTFTNTFKLNTASNGTETKELTMIRCSAPNLNAADVFSLNDYSLAYFEDCTFTNVYATDDNFFVTSVTNNVPLTFVIKDCTFSLKTELIGASSYNFEVFSITGSSITWTDVITTGVESVTAISLTSTELKRLETVRITGNTFTVNNPASTTVMTYIIFLGLTSGDVPVRSVNISDNTFTTLIAGYKGVGIQITTGTEGTHINNNEMYGFSEAIFDQGTYTEITGNIIKATNPIRISGAIGGTLGNNTILSIDGTTTGRCVVLGREEFSVESTDHVADTFTATTYVSATEWDLPDVVTDGTMIAVAISDADTGTLEFTYAGTIVDKGANTVTVKEWLDENGDVGLPTVGDYAVRCIRWPSGYKIFNNIFDGRDASLTFTFDFAPWDQGNYVDNNCYLTGTNFMSNLGDFGSKLSNEWATVAQMRTEWLTYSAAYPDNDAGTISEDPKYADPSNGDYTPTNPALKLDDNTWIGGVQPQAVGGDVRFFNRFF